MPGGLTLNDQTLTRYLDDARLTWNQDKNGTAGILSLSPFHESLDWDGEFDRYLEAATQIRELLMQGEWRESGTDGRDSGFVINNRLAVYRSKSIDAGIARFV